MERRSRTVLSLAPEENARCCCVNVAASVLTGYSYHDPNCTAQLAELCKPPQGGTRMRRKALASMPVAALSISAAPAFADPDFGPGNSSKGPNDGGAKCHPPGQTVNTPGCK
jgi:hypothetical protein